MLSLDLFNTVYERALNEGAVDDLEARHIHGLSTKMLDLMTRAKNAKPEMKAALMREYAKIKDERDSFFKIKNEMGYGSLTHEGEVTRTAGSLKHRSTNAYGGTPKEKDPLATLDKAGTNRAERALGIKFDREKKYQGGLDLDVDEAGIPGNVPADKIPGKEDLLKGKGRQTYEAQAQKKNSNKPLDQALQRLKVKARREHPRAQTDDEAVALQIFNKEQQDVAQLSRENDREDRLISRLADLEQNLQQQINDLKTDEISEHGGGIGPKQHWQDLMQERKLNVGDPVVVTAANEFEGKTGEISEFSPSGKFVVVNLYNHGEHSMHLSDVEFNQYADDQDQDDWYDEVDEGWQDFNKVEPYEVCLAGKPVKTFDYYEDARRFHDNWKKKLYNQGEKEKADKITLNPIMKEEYGAGENVPSVSTQQWQQAYQKAMQAVKMAKTQQEYETASERAGKLKDLLASKGITVGPALGEEKTRLDPKCWKGKKIGNPKTKMKGGVRVNNCVPAESINEEQDTSGVESAILRRIMTAHTDLLMKFGPEKVMQAAEEVAYNVGDVDEVGSSDVSAWVHEVKQILGAV